jgi:hypothetical protein
VEDLDRIDEDYCGMQPRRECRVQRVEIHGVVNVELARHSEVEPSPRIDGFDNEKGHGKYQIAIN